jgi:hypothetical protein
MKEDLLLNGNAKSKIKVTLFIKFSCVAAYHQVPIRKLIAQLIGHQAYTVSAQYEKLDDF